MIGKPWRRWHTVVVVRDGVDAGTVAITGMHQLFVCPEIIAADRVAGGTITHYRHATDVFQKFFLVSIISAINSALCWLLARLCQ